MHGRDKRGHYSKIMGKWSDPRKVMHCSKCTICAFATESCLRVDRTQIGFDQRKGTTQTEVVEEKYNSDTKGKFRFINFC